MELITTYICKEFDLGIHSNMFGGRIMSIIDESAGAYAAQVCDTPHMVTIKVDGLTFKKAVKIGNILKIYGKVDSFGNTSMTLYMEMRRHNVYTGEQETVTSTHITFVRIDTDGNPIPISDLVKIRYQERIKKFKKALLDKEERLKEKEQLKVVS